MEEEEQMVIMEGDNELQIVEVPPKPIEVIDLSSDDDDDNEPKRLPNPRSFNGIAAYLTSKKSKWKKKKNKRKAEQLFAPAEPSGIVGEKVKQEDDAQAVKTKNHVIPRRMSPFTLVVSSKKGEYAESSKAAEVCQMRQRADCGGSAIRTDLLMPTSGEVKNIPRLNSTSYAGQMAPPEAIIVKKLEKLSVNAAEEGRQPHTVKPDAAESGKNTERGDKEIGVTPMEVKSLEQRNVVLQKLLRGPRYFDVPKSFWNQDDHDEVDHGERPRKRACFICGSFEHIGKHCVQGLDCFFCQRRGHLAKDCPEKNECCTTSRLCLRCGEWGHDMASCMSNYSSDDLQKIQCYVCRRFGHLCCVNFPETGPELVTCYNCGQPGHAGMVCQMTRRDDGQTRIFRCYLCGGNDHFAVECPNATMAQQRVAALSTAHNQRINTNNGVMQGSQSVAQRSMELHPLAPVEYNRGLGRWQMDPRSWGVVKYGGNQWTLSSTSSRRN